MRQQRVRDGKGEVGWYAAGQGPSAIRTVGAWNQKVRRGALAKRRQRRRWQFVRQQVGCCKAAVGEIGVGGSRWW